MPIVGLSDRESVDPRFKEIGRIRKGAEKTANQPGKDLDYFRYVPDAKYPESAAVFEKIYGKEPTRLEVFFPFHETERVFSSWRERYGQNRLCTLRCDGDKWHDWIDGDRHYHSEKGKSCTFKYKDTDNKCPDCPLQYTGKLSVILRPMWEGGQIGLVTVLTTSINDIAVLAAKLIQYEPLAGKPFTLWREDRRIGVPIQGKRQGVDKSLLNLELTEERLLLEFNASRMQAAAQLEAIVPQQAYTDEATDEPDDIEVKDAEFDEVEPEPETPTTPVHRAPVAKVDQVPPPNNLAHGNIAKLAVVLGGYDNPGQVKVAMLALYGPQWERTTEWSPSEAWYQLQAHAQAGRES